MKPMRVLNCTKEDREIIFKIADKVGCPVDEYIRNHIDDQEYPHIFFDGKDICSSCMTDNPVSFSDFITELLKYEKPKKWVVKELNHAQKEINFKGIYTEYVYRVYCPHKNPKFTCEVEE